MADPLSTPRLTSPHLEHFTSRTIRLVGTFPRAPLLPISLSTPILILSPGGLGRVTQLRGDNATLDSDGAVTAHLNRDSHLTVGNWVEVVGKVNGDLSVRVLDSRDLGRDGALLPRRQRGEVG
jgi:replication factor A3